MKRTLALALALAASVVFSYAQEKPKPLRILLITGGCCHDYAKQKDILKKGIEERVHAKVIQAHTDDSSTAPPAVIVPDSSKWDAIIHDECAADVKDPALVALVLKPHRDGVPGVNLHCAMHSYRVGNPGKPHAPGTPEAMWFDYLGLQSSSHGPQLPIELSVADEKNPVTKSLVGWTTGREELYNNIQVTTGKSLARGKQGAGDKAGQNDAVVVWTNEYSEKKTRVFSTTLGHNNATVEDPKYLDLVARGLLWATDKLNDDGTAKAGYGPGGK